MTVDLNKHDIPQKIMAFQSKESVKARLDLHGTIAEWGVSLSRVKSALQSVKGASEIEVHINSKGGDVFESIAIMNYLMLERKEKIVTIVDGLAASGASAIFMAGDERIMPKNTQIMIHNPWTFSSGNAKDFRKLADKLEKIESSFDECYLTRFKGTHEELKVLLDNEEQLNAEECVTLGFATEVTELIEKPKENEENQAQSFKNQIVAKYGGETQTSELNSEDESHVESQPENNLMANLIKHIL